MYIYTYVYVYSLVAQMVKNPPAMRETRVRSLGCKDPLEECMTTHSSYVLPGESPCPNIAMSDSKKIKTFINVCFSSTKD